MKGQLFGMLLVLTIFGILAAALVPAFKDAASNVSKNIAVDASTGSVFNEANRIVSVR